MVIPCYNQAHYLADAIVSALVQTHTVEVVVVNDGSPDDTSTVAAEFPVVLVEKENGGLSSARNAGIAAASGEFVLPLDADDIIERTYVEKCLPRFDDPEVKVVNCWQSEFGDHRRVLALGRVDSVDDIIMGNRVVCCSMFRKADWQRIGGYDEQMRDGYEDWEFWIRLLKAGGRVETIPEPLFGYRKHGRSMIDDTNEKADGILRYIKEKHWGLYSGVTSHPR